jgi:hypothetical protein
MLLLHVLLLVPSLSLTRQVWLLSSLHAGIDACLTAGNVAFSKLSMFSTWQSLNQKSDINAKACGIVATIITITKKLSTPIMIT